jgi:hypothetical protein
MPTRPLPLIAACLALALPGLAGAQTVPNLSGTWVLQVTQSDFGPLPAPEARTDVIDHREPQLTVARTATAQGQQTQLNFAYVVDGEPHRNNAGGAEVTSRLRWEGATLVMVSTASGPQGEVTFTDRYTLSADGRTLTQVRTVAIEDQEISQRMVLTKP